MMFGLITSPIAFCNKPTLRVLTTFMVSGTTPVFGLGVRVSMIMRGMLTHVNLGGLGGS